MRWGVHKRQTPRQWVRDANVIAHQRAQDAPLRALASAICASASNVPAEAPELVARWVRQHVRYEKEAPGTEILQGPYSTLPCPLQVGPVSLCGFGVGDCDDLAMLWAALVRALGSEAWVVGVADAPEAQVFRHAIGRDAAGRLWELTDDSRYGGAAHPVAYDGGGWGYFYDPLTNRETIMSCGCGGPCCSGQNTVAMGTRVDDLAALVAQNRGVLSSRSGELAGHGVSPAQAPPSALVRPGGADNWLANLDAFKSLTGGAFGRAPVQGGEGGDTPWGGIVSALFSELGNGAFGGAASGLLAAGGAATAASGPAAPIVAGIVVAAIGGLAIGQSVSCATKSRNRRDLYQAWRKRAAEALGLTGDANRSNRERVYRLIDLMAVELSGTQGRVGQADWFDRRPETGTTWADGDVGRKRGVDHAFGGQPCTRYSVMQAHFVAAEQVARFLEMQRQENRWGAFAGLLLATLGGFPFPFAGIERWINEHTDYRALDDGAPLVFIATPYEPPPTEPVTLSLEAFRAWERYQRGQGGEGGGGGGLLLGLGAIAGAYYLVRNR